MKILSRYSVLEYLLWVKNNSYLVDDRNRKFCDLLNSNYKTLQVFQHKLPSRNIIFKFQLGTKLFFFKQHGPDLGKREGYFWSEVSVLNTNLLQLPKLVYQDKLANIIIVEALIDYHDFSSLLKEKSNNLPDDYLIIDLIKKMAEVIRAIHNESKLQTQSAIQSKNSEDRWNEFLRDKPELWGNNLTKEFLDSNSKTHYIHHDLKGSNILINDINDIKILDWEMSEKGDPCYDLCFIIFEICSVFISPDFLQNKINSQQSVNWAKKFISLFVNTYSSIICIKKINIFFKLIFFEFKKNEFYFKNIDLLLPYPK